MPSTSCRSKLFHWSLLLAVSSLLLVSPSRAASPTPFPEPSSANSLFQNRPIGALPPPTATPRPKHYFQDEEEVKPIPRSWWIGGIVIAVLAVVALLYGAARSWRSSNLFDRQYRFPTGGTAALRFGGMRSGGHMATLNLDGETLPPPSKTEDV